MRDRQRFGSRVGAGFAEWIGPEKLVARVVQFHSGEKRMSAIEILDHAVSPARFLTPYIAGLFKRPLGASEKLEDEQAWAAPSRPGPARWE